MRRPLLLGWAGLVRPLAASLAFGFGWHLGVAELHQAPEATAEDVSPQARLVALLAREFGLEASKQDVFWVDEPTPARLSRLWPLREQRAWLRARLPGGLDDVFLVDVERTAEGHVLAAKAVFNLTQTFAVEETALDARGERAAWAVGDDEHVYRVQTADLATARQMSDGLSWQQRLQWHLTWLQQTGQWGGITQRTFKLDPAARQVSLSVGERDTRLVADERVTLLPRAEPVTEGAAYVVEEPQHVPRPSNWLTWGVDRLRAWPAFGDERMQLLKAVVYKAWDRVGRWLPALAAERDVPLEFETRVSGKAGGATLASGAALGQDARDPAPRLDPRPGEPSTAFPPPALEPLQQPPEPDEGVWQSLHEDPFTRSTALGSAFYTTFLRPDPERRFARVLIVVWDPRTVTLNTMAGTEEPVSATGARGTGLIPREPKLLERVVGAFNGGFQATHGAHGMKVDGTLLVPPLPYAATVGRLSDGRTAFGTWPAAAEVPEALVSFRQNLTPLVQAGVWNPYGRTWWGGVPQGWQDDTQTVRSGLCLTKRGFVAYFYGTKLDAAHLGRAMLAADCDYALHLDMNQGHTGFEFYRIGRAPDLPPLAVALDGMWQAEGPLEGAPDFRFRGRRLFRGMQLMNFPRYIQTEARDFFYLTLRPQLPGEPLRSVPGSPHARPGEGLWTTPEGVPSSVAERTEIRPDPSDVEARVRLVRWDPFRFSPTTTPSADAVSSWEQTALTGELGIWWQQGVLSLAKQAPSASFGATADAQLLLSGAEQVETATAAVGVSEEGWLVYAELAGGAVSALRGPAVLRRALAHAGVSRPVYLPRPPSVRLGSRDLDLHPRQSAEESGEQEAAQRVFLRPSLGAGSAVLFPDTPVVSRQIWHPLQERKGPHGATQPADGSAVGP